MKDYQSPHGRFLGVEIDVEISMEEPRGLELESLGKAKKTNYVSLDRSKRRWADPIELDRSTLNLVSTDLDRAHLDLFNALVQWHELIIGRCDFGKSPIKHSLCGLYIVLKLV